MIAQMCYIILNKICTVFTDTGPTADILVLYSDSCLVFKIAIHHCRNLVAARFLHKIVEVDIGEVKISATLNQLKTSHSEY